MAARKYALLFSILATTSLCGCSQTIDLYHDAEGGAIAKHRQPPPGANLPYPNLADVPAVTQANPFVQPVHPGGLAASPGALAGLTLPVAPPPAPTVSGSGVSSGTASHPAQQEQTQKTLSVKAAERPPGPPVSIAFQPKSALLSYNQQVILDSVAAKRGEAHVRVCGFGEGSLPLALMRARRLADALTAAGVPGRSIIITAFAAGSGGFVELVY